MPFLIPALLSLSSDIVLLILGRFQPSTPVYDEDHWVYHVKYLVYLAIARLVLLLLPLLFHSYTGTALRFQLLYMLLYWGTLAILVVHTVSLTLMNPESLEALIPIDASNISTAFLHELRRIWWMLSLSIVSDISHLIILMHVRSTAPTHPLLTGNKRPPSVYYTLRSQNLSNGRDEEPMLMNAMTDFVEELQSQLRRTKVEWAAKLEEFTLRISNQDRPIIQNPLAPLTPFRVLLQLFATEDVSDKLDSVFDMDDGESMTFFVPQLLSFLLHSALFQSEKLEDWILSKCRRNVHFAHRCYWFLRAWCLEVPAEPPSISRQNSEGRLSLSSGGGLAPFLDEPVEPQERIPCGGLSASARGSSSKGQEKFFSTEERVMIERLMLRVKECGEEAADALFLGPREEIERTLSTCSSDTVQMGNGNGYHIEIDWSGSPSDLMQAAESGTIPIDPTTGYPSVKHLDTVTAQQKYGFLPLDEHGAAAKSSSLVEQGHSETEQFDKTPHFLDALVFLADNLFQVNPKDRKEELRKQLRVMECELLPSNAIYVPIGNVHHRVWRIVSEESIPIGTKERVPCIVCLEVVDYSQNKPHSKGRAWSILDRHMNRNQKLTSNDSVESPSPGRRTTLEGIELTDFKSESETVNSWRFERRDPLRRSSIFDKVTSTVRDSMKLPMQKLGAYRQSGEFLSLTLNDALVEEEPPIMRQESDPAPMSAENYRISRWRKSVREETNMSRSNSAGSLASMGQWTSPQPSERVIRQPPQGSLDGLRLRLQDNLGDDSETPSLKYGSDQEEEHAIDPKKSDRKGRPPRESSIVSKRRPPVVFRESWATKEERIRAKSAYGQHPGWRLLPVLIKANDDLRQEQLASQLIYRMAAILAREKVPVWLCPYEIIALTESGGIIEAIPDTISLDSLKRNDPHFRGLKYFFLSHFGDGSEEFADAQANFVESLAAYSIVCFLLQLKDRHNGNILLDNRGHIIHIDFGFFFLSSPGKNAGFESAPFKLTRDFVEVLGGPDSRLFRTFRELCYKTFITLRKHCMEIILLVEMLKTGNEELGCFRGRPDEAIRQLRERFRLDLNDRACREYVNCLVDNSIENWRTDWYDRYQRYFVGVL